ncbi:MAG: alanine racemase domain protein [Frankiales bacterium]|nr:alanine racemase domain protein [Frankiales bacterium]
MSADRAAELAASLAEVEQRLVEACVAAGRAREEVLLLAVTKTWPLSDVLLLRDLGLQAFGENRDQEAAGKARELPGVHWHFVGQVQTNKAASVAAYASVVHALDRPSLAQALSRGAAKAGRTVEVLVQVRLDDADGRGGAAPDDVPALADLAAGLPGLRLAGVMAVAPLGQDPAPAFARLHDVAARLRADHPDAADVSAGMSGDLEQAVAAGATIVRIGTALLGRRSPPAR